MPTRQLWFWGPKNHEDLASANLQTYHKVSGGAYIVRMYLSQRTQNPEKETVANILRTEPLPATKQKKRVGNNRTYKDRCLKGELTKQKRFLL